MLCSGSSVFEWCFSILRSFSCSLPFVLFIRHESRSISFPGLVSAVPLYRVRLLPAFWVFLHAVICTAYCLSWITILLSEYRINLFAELECLLLQTCLLLQRNRHQVGHRRLRGNQQVSMRLVHLTSLSLISRNSNFPRRKSPYCWRDLVLFPINHPFRFGSCWRNLSVVSGNPSRPIGGRLGGHLTNLS